MSQQNYPPPGDPQSEGWALENPAQPGSPADQQAGGYPTDPPAADPYAADPFGAGPYQAAGYPPGAYPPQFYVQPRPNNTLALTAMIVSICGMVMCPLIGIVGAIMGHKARKQIRETGEQGDGFALAGIIVGWIGFGFIMAIILLYVVIFGVVFATGGFDTSSTS